MISCALKIWLGHCKIQISGYPDNNLTYKKKHKLMAAPLKITTIIDTLVFLHYVVVKINSVFI